MQNMPSETDDELLEIKRIEENRARRQRKRFEGLDPESLLWLVLPAAWTRSMAQACDFPSISFGMPNENFLDTALQRGLVTANPQMRWVGDEVESYDLLLVNDIDRAQILDYFLSTHPFTAPNPFTEQSFEINVQRFFSSDQGGASAVRSTLVDIGQRLASAAPHISDLPPLLALWAELAARADDTRNVAVYFDEQTEPAFKQHNTGLIQDWIEAARPLVALLEKDPKDPYTTVLARSIRLARRRVELLYRRNIDSSHLDDYFRRVEQVRVFNELMDGSPELWALHYLGAGGAGKTMLMRDLTLFLTGEIDPFQVGSNHSETVREVKQRPNVIVARVDFDYLNADYPRIDPGQLLNELSEELLAYDPKERAAPKFNDARVKFNEVREKVDSGFLNSGALATQLPEFQEGIQSYIDGLKILDKQVLIILDTCEELAKASDQGSATIDETFRILRALHDGRETLLDENAAPTGGLPNLRVVLSGRRALAKGGELVDGKYQWILSPCHLPERPFLRLHEMRGFTRDEVCEFLTYEKINDRYIDPIWKASSPDINVIYKIARPNQPSLIQPAAEERCNPYKMSQFRDWARDSNPPTPEDIARATPTTYIKVRIIDRLSKDQLEFALPAAAVLGHFNRSALAAACGLSEAQVAQAFDRLSEQEWVAYATGQTADENDRLVLHTEHGTRDGLLSYYNQNNPDLLNAVRRRAGQHLRARIDAIPLDQIDWSLLDAALSASQAEPELAAEWWRALERRMFNERDPQWVLDTLERILNKDGSAYLRDATLPPETPPENTLRPLALATRAAALLNNGDTGSLPALWKEVAVKSEGIEALHITWLRAKLGRIAAAGYMRAQISSENWIKCQVLPGLLPANDPDLQAALVAAQEALVESDEQNKDFGNLAASEAADSEITDKPASALTDEALLTMGDEDLADLYAFKAMLEGRHHLILGNLDAARTAFTRALKLTPHRRGKPARRWLDWSPPVALRTRLRLELARLGCPALFTPEETLEMLRSWYGEMDWSQPNTDIDRFWSCVTHLQLAIRPVVKDVPPSRSESDLPAFSERRLTFSAIQPAAYRLVPPLFVVEAEVLAAQGHVEQALSRLKAITTQTDIYETRDIQHAERSLLRLIHRYRLAEEGETSGALLASSTDPADQALLRDPFIQPPKSTRAQKTQQDETIKQPDLTTETGEVYEAWQSWMAMGYRQTERLIQDHIDQLLEDPSSWFNAHPGEPEMALFLTFRLIPAKEMYSINNLIEGLQQRIGIRRAAEIALEVADRLVTEQFEQATSLYVQAAGWFEACDSPAESLISWTSADLCRIRSGQFDGNTKLEEGWPATLERAYKNTSASLSIRLPDYTDISILAMAPTRAGLEALRPVGWQPWLIRLAYVLGRGSASMKVAPVDLSGWRGWFAANDAPLEIDSSGGWLGIEESVSETIGGDQTGVERPRRTWVRILLNGILWMLGLAAIGALTLVVIAVFKGLVTQSASAPWLKGVQLSLGSLVSGIVMFALFIVGLLSERQLESAVTPSTDQDSADTSHSSRSWFSWGQNVLIILFLLSMLGILAGLVWAASIALESNVLTAGWSAGVRDALAFVLVAAGIWLFYGLVTLPGNVRSLLASQSYLLGVGSTELTKGASSASSQPAESSPIYWHWTKVARRFSILRFPPLYSEQQDFDYPIKADTSFSSGPYPALAEWVSPELRQVLKNAKKSLKKRTMPITFEPSEGLQGPCWEAALVYGALETSPGETYKDTVPFRFIRQVSTRVAKISTGPAADAQPMEINRWRLPDVPGGLRVLAWVSPEDKENYLLVENAWQNRRNIHRLNLQSEQEAADADLVHLLGKVDSRRGTVSLRTTGGDEKSHSAQQALTAIDVRRRFPHAQLCVVQSSPQQDQGERLPSDRRETGLGRVLCSELATQGIPVVIYLPALPPELARSVLAALAGSCKPEARLAKIHAGLRMAQDLIVKDGKGSNDAWERALDVCLYIASNNLSAMGVIIGKPNRIVNII